jgi:hypothetical protein
MAKLVLLTNTELVAESRREDLDGIPHLVVPVVAIREGVLNNVLYPEAELSEFVEAWNGVPVPVGHPMSGDTAVTANSIEAENTVNIGKFYNVTFQDSAIKGEIWINIEKAEKLNFSDIVEKLESGEMMEISTGLHRDEITANGEFNGIPYESVINKIRPDHLALLPNHKGACSIDDGCGAMRTNCKDGKCDCGGKCKTPKKETIINRLLKRFGINSDTSFNEKETAVRKALRDAHGKDTYPYIVVMFDGFVIFELGPTLYKQSYTLDSNTKATLTGNHFEVAPRTEYVPIITTNKMNPEHKTAVVLALASAMAVNQAVTEESKTSLAAMPDDMLLNMATQYKINKDGTPQGEPKKVDPVVVNAEQAQPTLTPEQADLLNNLQKVTDDRMKGKRDAVVALHTSMTDDIVANMQENALDALIGNSVVEGDASYALNGSPAVISNEEADYQPPSIFTAQLTKEGN